MMTSGSAPSSCSEGLPVVQWLRYTPHLVVKRRRQHTRKARRSRMLRLMGAVSPASRSSFACRSSLGCDFAACDRSPRYTFTAALLLRAHAALRYQCDNSFGLMVDSQRDRLEELLSAEHCGGLRVRSGGDAVPVCLLHELLLINADEVACHGVPEAASGARAYLEREVYLSAGALQTCRITPVLRARPVPRAPGGISCAQFGRYALETRDES